MMADLATGRIEVEIDRAAFPPSELFGFAQRRNPKRAFLFVSRVLGRHVPVAPSAMRAAFKALADGLPDDLPGPVLVMGMAETAVGLGAGVHREYALRTGRADTVFLTSTRHALGTPLMARFSEDHSHATAHLIHEPTDGETRTLVAGARSLVLVDDEITTGNTLANLFAALSEAGLSRIERMAVATLTDWSGGVAASRFPVPATVSSLLQGRYRWTPLEGAPVPEMPHVDVTGAGTHPIDASLDWGRLGARSHPARLSGRARAQPGERILVLGTGEHVWEPFLLAEALEAAGADVRFSAVTRSPIAMGHAIGAALAFTDNYGLGIPNYAYNVHPESYDRVILCSETSESALDPILLRALGPTLQIVSDGPIQ